MRERVEATNELVVRESVDELGGFGAICLSLGRAAAHGAGESTYGLRGSDQRLVVEQRRGIDSPVRPGVHRVVVPAVEAVAGQLDHELDALFGAGVAETGERSLEVGVRLVVAAEEVLDARARDGEADTQRLGLLRDDVHALEKGCVALAELAGGGERFGTGQQQLDAAVARRIGR